MSEYVIVWAQRCNSKDEILLVLKDKPEWQNGKLNLPGGKIEEGETPQMAAVRELEEESGYKPLTSVTVMGVMQDGSNTIHCVKAVVMGKEDPHPREEETQDIFWTQWYKVDRDDRLIPNLRVIVPLMICGVKGWIIGDTYRGTEKERHTIKISVPTRNEYAD
jgi:8-oxo-dGTP pyrophosphatase MutT (NUDIX family)